MIKKKKMIRFKKRDRKKRYSLRKERKKILKSTRSAAVDHPEWPKMKHDW
jgi:hypothetical protein